MPIDIENEIFTIEGVEYNISELTSEAKSIIQSISFIETQLQQLQNEWAIADTARIGYTRALEADKLR